MNIANCSEITDFVIVNGSMVIIMMMNKNKLFELVRYRHPLNYEFSFDIHIEKIHTQNTNER